MKKITVSPDNISKTNGGIFEGWGTSLCWWANRVGFSEKLTKDSARLFFSPEGLWLNIMRYNIGGGDDPTHNHIERTDSEMPGWWKYDEKTNSFLFNSDTDKNQLRVLSACAAACGETTYVEAFSNSPPYYMTVSGCTSGSKSAIASNLKKSCINDFASYLTDVVCYIQNDLGIKIKSLAPMNEPFTNYWKAYSPKQEGCHISPGQLQSSLLIATAESMKKKSLTDVVLTASDETNTTLQLKALKRLSPEALATVGRISTHTYKKATPKVGELARQLNKNLWMSETDWSSVSGENAGEMGPALFLGEKIIEDMNTLSPSGWVIWQIVAAYLSRVPDSKGRLDMPCLPDLEKGYWGTAFADIDKQEIYLTQKYYAFGQFSRYIRPEMSIIHTGKTSLGAYDKTTGRVVLVCLNSKNEPCDISVLLDFSPKKQYRITPIRTSGSLSQGEHWKKLSPFDADTDSFSYTLPGNSITTFLCDIDIQAQN